MPFCEECGNNLAETAKFCNECGNKVVNLKSKEATKEKVVTKKTKKKISNDEEEINTEHEQKDIEELGWDLGKAREMSEEQIDNHLKAFFTPPAAPSDSEQGGLYLGITVCVLFGLLMMMSGDSGECIEYDWYGDCVRREGGDNGGTVLFGLILLGCGGFLATKLNNPNAKYEKKLKHWRRISPEPLFLRLEKAQKMVAESSFEGLGINKSAKPSEGGIIRKAAYSFGPSFDFNYIWDEELIGGINIPEMYGRIDTDGPGKGAGYFKISKFDKYPGLYAREYDMIVLHFTKNQILVYQCIFDILEMTKRLEQSYEWNYKHVVGINISGDDTEKKLGDSISVTGTKYMVISAASGDKIEIILGAQTTELGENKGKQSALGGEDKIFEVANSAIANVRQAIRDKAD